MMTQISGGAFELPPQDVRALNVDCILDAFLGSYHCGHFRGAVLHHGRRDAVIVGAFRSG